VNRHVSRRRADPTAFSLPIASQLLIVLALVPATIAVVNGFMVGVMPAAFVLGAMAALIVNFGSFALWIPLRVASHRLCLRAAMVVLTVGIVCAIADAAFVLAFVLVIAGIAGIGAALVGAIGAELAE
jgi:hypothetical protein